MHLLAIENDLLFSKLSIKKSNNLFEGQRFVFVSVHCTSFFWIFLLLGEKMLETMTRNQKSRDIVQIQVMCS